jgi:hypothetical protein
MNSLTTSLKVVTRVVNWDDWSIFLFKSGFHLKYDFLENESAFLFVFLNNNVNCQENNNNNN